MMVLQISILLALVFLPLQSDGQSLNIQTCSRDNMAIFQPDANAYIGGIISLNTPGTGGYGCGQFDGDMQSFEAMRWVLDLLNKKDEKLNLELLTDYYVPGIRLGMMVRNYCNNDLSAVAAVMNIFPEINGDDMACTAATNNFTLGIIGATTSDDAITLSDATMDYKIPVISYEATATQLTMSGMHPNFMRTISPDGPLMEAIVQVMTKLKWNYVVVVYDSGLYGRQAYSELHARLVANGICLTAGIMIDADNENTAKDTLNSVLGTNATGAVYFGPRNYAEAIIREGDRMLPMAGRLQWLLNDISLETTFVNSSLYQRGIISISAASRFIVEFEDHWIRINESNSSPENPWFTSWYEERYNCKFSPIAGQTSCYSFYQGLSEKDIDRKKREEFQQGQNVEASVMAVFTYANALRTAQMTLCPRVSGACPALQAMSREQFLNDYVKKVNFTFSSDERVPSLASNNVPPYNSAKQLGFTPYGDVMDPAYYIYNYNDIDTSGGPKTFKFRRVGSYIRSYLDLNLANVGMYSENRQVRVDPLPSSLCPAQGCTPCLGLPSNIKYYFEQGDVIVNGIFSLHQMGVSPLTCGPMMSINQYMYLEAMIYAVSKVNQDNTILKNVILGGLGMDDCSSSTLGQAFLAQVQRGNLKIVDRSGSQLNPRKIEAYSAAYNTLLTLPLAEAMNMLMKPMVGYRAGGSKLDDRSKYPYYIRAMPGIYEEMKAIILLLKKRNWKYVQVVTSDSEYSQDAQGVFRKLASKAGICIVVTHMIGQSSQDADDAVSNLNANSATQPTVVLLEGQDIRRLLVAFNNSMTAPARLVLIGTSMWGTDREVINGLESVSRGVITLSLKHSTLNSFKEYLRGLNVNTYTLNPWFKEWYMAAHNCSLDGQGMGSPCNQSSPITDGVNFQLLYQVESVINAIRAIGYGLDSTLRKYCNDNYSSVCSTFLTSQNKGATFLEAIQNVSFSIEDTNPVNTFRFVGRSAAIPFEINNYFNGSYTVVGEIDTWSDMLTLFSSNIVLSSGMLTDTSSSCATSCQECPFIMNYLDYWYIPGDVVIGGIFDVHNAGNWSFSCGTMRAKNGAMYTEVFNYALEKINSGTASVRLRNVTLGGLAFDGCSNSNRATAIVSQVHTGMDIVDSSGAMFKTSQLISWMSYDSQTTMDTALLVQELDMPIVSPGATTPDLDDKKKYYTFFRTIPSDSVVVRGMAEFVKDIGKKYVIVLNAPDTSSRQSRDLFRKYLTKFGICIVANYEFMTDGTMNVILNGIYNTQTLFVAVFADPDFYIKDFLLAAQNQIRSNDLIYIANRPWGELNITQYTNHLINSVFFDLDFPTLTDLKNYLNSRSVGNSNNPWFSDIYQEILGCDLPGRFRTGRNCTNGSISGSWIQDIWTLPTVHAVYALAEGVHRTLQAKCGVNYLGVCPAFLYDSNIHDTIMSNMDAEVFTDINDKIFTFIEREANTTYTLNRYDYSATVVPEGSLDAMSTLSLTNASKLASYYSSAMSDCAGDCLVCSAQVLNIQDLTVTPGDFYIVGLFDVHKQGPTPYTCGAINDKHGLQLLEAFHYALEYVNSKSGMFSDVLPGVLLGGVGLDICQSPSRAAELVANLQSGNIQFAKNGVVVNPRLVDTYIAAMDTESTIRVADILTQLAIPQISYGATGMDLLDRQKYPYFVRSVPADDKQARAMVSYLKKFSYNNIQVINSFDEIGEPGMIEFKRLALVNKICITKEYTAGDVAVNATEIVNMIAQNQNASVVVLWFKNPLPILEVVNNMNNIISSVLFIATDKWGANPEYLTLPSIRNLLEKRNLIILDVETADIPGFDQYLEDKTPDNYKSDPWFQEYFEMLQNCYWDTPTTSSTPCDKSSTIPRADNYKQDPYVLYVINAVFSAALAMDDAIYKRCVEGTGDQSYYGACGLYSTSGERRQMVMQSLLKVNFTDDTHQSFFFTEDGQSNRGFHIYNISEPNPLDFQYQNVGSYNDSNFLKLDITYDSNYKAHCDADAKGCDCKFEEDTPTRYMKKADGKRGLSIVYVGDIHQVDPSNPLTCGPINTGVDLQKLLAFFYAIEQVNNNTVFANSLKLDGLALDSCTHGLRLGQDVYNVLSGNGLCDSRDGLLVSPSSILAFVVDKDRNTLPVASMLFERNITTISPTAGSDLLDNRYLYPYFLRIRGDNEKTAKVILEMAKNVQWDYLSILYTDTIDYRDMANSFLDKSRELNTCVGDAVSLPVGATQDDVIGALEKLSEQVGARAVVLFVDPSQMNLLLQASRFKGLTGRFVWIVASDWAQGSSQIAGLEQEAAGAIIVETRSAVLSKFTEYVKSLTYMNRRGIPDDWFDDIYETLHQCNIFNLERPSTNRFSRICTMDEVIMDNMVIQDPSVLHVILSVYSVAYGVSNIPACGISTYDVAACLQLQSQRYDQIYRGILAVDFQVPDIPGSGSFIFTFDDNGNGELGYTIKNFRISADSSQNPYSTYEIGNYTTQGLYFNKDAYAASNLYDRTISSSNCAPETVCTCRLSDGRTWSYAASKLFDPSNVKVGEVYLDALTGEPVKVNAVPSAGDRFRDGWAIILSILACIGAVVSLALFIYLLIMYPVRGGTSTLGFILSFGIILLYLMVFPFIAHAETQICGLRRFGLGLVYSIVYSALLVKLIDCWRVMTKSDPYNIKYSKLGTPAGLFIVTLFFVLVQVIINAEWLILVQPGITRIFYNNQYWPRCTPDDFYDQGLVLSLVYIMVIILVALILALATFRTMKNHRETRWILGTLVINIICWVIWCTASILGAIKIRDAAVAIGLLVNATAMLLLMPVRKLYLLHKYNVAEEKVEMEEAEKQSTIAASQRGNDYNSVNGRQYDNNPKLHDAGSNHGSSYMYKRPNSVADYASY